MRSINIHEAKTNLSRLVDEAVAGREVVIGKAGKPLVKLVPVEAPSRRRLGVLRGRLEVPDDFDAPLSEEELALFEGEPEVAKRSMGERG
ncbi:MAG: type II toxin-antitoxin system prevent-host-death family antitoxin [Bradymonadales bacterium]|nr:type II toxin-antitoxin system prevent-host-death family antitoxin [Bradymonadales bacterium]